MTLQSAMWRCVCVLPIKRQHIVLVHTQPTFIDFCPLFFFSFFLLLSVVPTLFHLRTMHAVALHE